MPHELLGTHKASPEWYTPSHIWEKIYNTFGTQEILDPCPIGGVSGLETEWLADFIYINPPTPARLWAEKAIVTFRDHPNTSIIYAAFSESVLWQVPELMTYPIVFVRNRIKWDSNKTDDGKRNAPRNYNAFILLSNNAVISQNFKAQFGDLGFLGRMVIV
ncbi:MAG: hypothetical protein KME22_07915 [Hassallia sp. WJT32-NPBG1]|jgi:hypothetical protein|nr:hypothetical protein [Hassallia sp. WJT32-NPBG1]